MSISSIPIDGLAQSQLNSELTRLKGLESGRAQYLKTASKVCLCCSIPSAYCHLLLCSSCIFSAIGENRPPLQRNLFERMCVWGTDTYRGCWEGALSAPENRCDFCCLAFKGVEGCAEPPRDWKAVALLPPERQRMEAISSKLRLKADGALIEGAPLN